MKLLRHLHLVVQLLFLVGPGVRADDVSYDCEVVENLYLTKEGYRPHPNPYPQIGSHLIISKQSGEVRGPSSLLGHQWGRNLEWQRIRVVKVSPDYHVFMTRGYASDGTPVKEVIVTEPFASRVTQFVSIDLLTSADIFDGTCE